MAEVVSYSQATKDTPLGWKPLALVMIEQAPNPVAILETFIDRFSPLMWEDSRATAIEEKAKLLEQFAAHSDQALRELAIQKRTELAREVEQIRKSETERDRGRDESFE